MAHDILEMAADVRQAKAQVDALCSDIKDANGTWTRTAIFADEAMKIATDGLRNCWMILDRIHRAAQEELERAKQAQQEGGERGR